MGHYGSCYEADAKIRKEERKADLVRWIKEKLKKAELNNLEVLHLVSELDYVETNIVKNLLKNILGKGE